MGMKHIILVIFFFTSIAAIGQREISENSGWSLKDRLYTGGGLGFNAGTDSYGNKYFYFALNPIVGYMVTPKFSVGTGVNWQRYSYSEPIKINIDQYGASPFLRYNFSELFAYGEYNLLNTPTINFSQRRTYDRLLLGLGYSQPLGGRGAINFMGLYDVIYDQNERAFPSPWVFRVFFSF
jgi:hypothetical protein